VPIAILEFATPLVATLAMSGSSIFGRAQRIARQTSKERGLMEALIYLVPMALVLGLLGPVGSLWSLESGQYEDLDGAAWRAIMDEDIDEAAKEGDG
jgi:cbb3-type cytochrome oxidase maturation protein